MLIDADVDWAEVLAAEDAGIAASVREEATPVAQGGSIAAMIEALANGDEATVQQG